jgi:hypothetical protein
MKFKLHSYYFDFLSVYILYALTFKLYQIFRAFESR